MHEQDHITFFVDPSWRKLGPHSPLLHPFWGNSFTEQTPFYKALFDRYGYDTRWYSITDDATRADMVLMPYAHTIALRHYPEIIEQCVHASKQFRIPLLIDGVGDIEYPVDLPHTFVLRAGGYRFEKKQNEIHIPLYADDLLERYGGGVVTPRHKQSLPIVGFSGWGTLSLKQRVRSVVKELPDRLHGLFDQRYQSKRKGVFLRAKAIDLLESSKLVRANILRRSSYSGHANTLVGTPEQLRRDFVDNVLSSDYCLDVRGDANASIRLFEITSLGRIPLIVDTQRNLPFSDELDYSTFALVVDLHNLSRLPSIVDETFVDMQRRARAAYERYFRVDALMPHIIRALREKMHRD